MFFEKSEIKELRKGFLVKMKYSTAIVLCVIQFLTLFLSISVVSSASLYITNEILNACDSPFKAFIMKQSDPVSDFCNIGDTCKKNRDDSRSVLCCGLLDLLSSSCSIRSGSDTNFKIDPSTENVDDFCIKWKKQVQTFNWSSFSLNFTTEFCHDVCGRHIPGTSHVKLHFMCPLLFIGHEMLSETPGSTNLQSKVEIPSMDSGLKAPSSSKGDNTNLKSNTFEGSSVEPPMDEKMPLTEKMDNKVRVEDDKMPAAVEPPSNAEGENFYLRDNMQETEENMKDASKPKEEVPETIEGKITNSVNEAENVQKVKTPVEPVVPDGTLDSGNPNFVTSSSKEMGTGEKTDAVNKPAIQDEDKTNVGAPGTKPSSFGNSQQANASKIVYTPVDSNQNLNPGLSEANLLPDGDSKDPGDDNFDVEPQSPQQEFQPKQNGHFQDAPDSPFFQYFMIISAAFILGYVAIVNKKKLIALIVEGRRDGSKRRHHSANYSKLDSNLEEALSSNRTTVSSHHVLY